LLYPSYLVNELVAEVLHHFEGKSVLRIDHPNEKETIGLKLLKRNVQNLFVIECVISNSHSTSRVGRRELPWRITSDHVKESTSIIHLLLR
jgi:hypothetical protein